MPEGLDQNDVENRTFLKKLFSSDFLHLLTKFIKKHKILLSVIAAVIVVLSLLFIFIPVININDTKLVNSGAEVRIEKGKTAKLKDGNASVVIVNFITDTCPVAGTCYFEENAVVYKLKINGVDYAVSSISNKTDKTIPLYKLETISSDYKTYSIIKITKKS